MAPDQRAPDQRAPARRALLRNIGVLVVLVAIVLVAGGQRFDDNPRRPRAEAFTDRIDEVFRDVRAGRLELSTEPDEVAADIAGVRTDRGRWGLAGEVDDTCYAVWWGDRGRRHVRIVPPGLRCEPRVATSDEPDTVARSALAADEDETGVWEPILPPRTVVRLWWIPLLIVAGWVGLSASTRIVVILVTKGRNLAHWGRPAS